MLARVFLWLTQGSGARRRWLFRNLFELIARLSGNERGWTFMNYGYAAFGGPDPRPDLTPEEEVQEVCCALYDRVASAVPIADKDVVEVSCGRGGGAAYVARHLRPRSMTGIDIAHAAIDFCRNVHVLGNLRFVQGDAESLPLFDESCDAVVNVEASFCYGDFGRFLDEVHRVLRPGGHFLFADLRFEDELPEWFAALEGSGLRLIEQEDISDNVIRALDLDGLRRERELRRTAPWLLRGPMRTFSGTPGSRIPVRLATGAMRYYRFVLEKPASVEAAGEKSDLSDQEAELRLALA
ncbi:MAG: class I SAM-dependent methyltransferase [Alphaproteobacteria bacterium]|nr:class I SAM-dependent methyltransferase [Alphaproteobacteria bacterium]